MKTDGGLNVTVQKHDVKDVVCLRVGQDVLNYQGPTFISAHLSSELTPAEARILAANLIAAADAAQPKRMSKDDIWGPDIPVIEPITTNVRKLNPEAWKG